MDSLDSLHGWLEDGTRPFWQIRWGALIHGLLAAGQVKCTRVWKESKSWQKLKSETNKFWCVVFKCRNIIALIGSLGRECRGRHIVQCIHGWHGRGLAGLKLMVVYSGGRLDGRMDRMVVPSAFEIKTGGDEQGGFCIRTRSRNYLYQPARSVN